MGRRKPDEVANGGKAKQNLSVSALLARMDENADRSKKGTNPASTRPKPKPDRKIESYSYTDGIELPSSDDEEDALLDSEEVKRQKFRRDRSSRALEIGMSEKQLKKREKKDMIAAHAAELAKQEALKDDHDAFSVVIAKPASDLEGEKDDADANVKDVTVNNFSVSARGKELLKHTSVTISHGKKYGLVGPNRKGKSTLLKLLAWRKILVPKNIDVLLVEQEIVGDDGSALEAVVSANEELIRLRKEVAAMSADDGEDSAGEKLSELYEKLQMMGSDAAEAHALKILAIQPRYAEAFYQIV